MPTLSRPTRHFLRHLLEMVAAMVLGMIALMPLAHVVIPPSWLADPTGMSLVMATSMAVPMAAWMAWRGHSAAATLEMAAAMYLSFALFFPLLWTGVLSGGAVLVLGHVLMIPAMVAAMLLRRREYTGEHAEDPEAALRA